MYNENTRRQSLGLDYISKLERRIERRPLKFAGLLLTLLAMVIVINISTTITYEKPIYKMPDVCELSVVECDNEKVAYTEIAYVTGYNTVEEQTDSTPCISATGDNICGRTDVVACPRKLSLGTKIEIDNKEYICLDRLAKKYDNRYDISCDKDMACPSRVTGEKLVAILK